MLLVILMALVIPIWMAKFNLHNIPTAVAEIIVGIVLGVSGFNWVDTSNSQLSFLSNLGVIILIFLSGMEIEFDLFKKKQDSQINPVKIASLPYQLKTHLKYFLHLLFQQLIPKQKLRKMLSVYLFVWFAW